MLIILDIVGDEEDVTIVLQGDVEEINKKNQMQPQHEPYLEPQLQIVEI